MNNQQGRLAVDGARLDTVRAVVALVAGQRNVVAADEADVELAMSIVDVFAHHPDGGALTVEQVAQGCGTSTSDGMFRSRFDLLVHEGVLRRRHGKAHQQRYTLNPAAYSGRLVFDRLRSDHGVSELIRLLDATLRLLRGQRATVVEVGRALRSMRTMLRLHADALTSAAEAATIGEVYAQQRAHSIGQFSDTIAHLHTLVHDRFGVELGRDARGLLEDAQAYQDAVTVLVRRVAAEGAAARTFMVLSPDEYRQAARGDVDALAAVVEHLLFDPPPVRMDAGAVAAASERPQRSGRRRPQPPPEVPIADPVVAAQTQLAARRRELVRVAERLLDGGHETDVTSRVGVGWPAAAALIADLLAIHRDPGLPFEVVFSDAVVVDADGPVTYLSPAGLRRIPTPATDAPADPDARAGVDADTGVDMGMAVGGWNDG